MSVWAAAHITQAIGLRFVVEVGDAGQNVRFLLGVAVLAFLNATLGRVLQILTIPLSCLTLGLFSLVVNALVLMLAASFNLGYRLEGEGFDKFLAAFVGSLLISFLNGILGTMLADQKQKPDEE